jgi:hypothetical protein
MLASVTDAPPAEVAAEITALQTALDRALPAKASDNLLIGTWNVRAFDRVAATWRTNPGDPPIRDLSNVACIAEIVRRMDMIAVQEVRRSAQAFLAMMQLLGPGWAYLVTDVTHGTAGNNERLAFAFDTGRVQPSGLACELVVAADQAGIAPDALTGQFARTPVRGFARDAARFTLTTLHVVYGNTSDDRIGELSEIAQWLARWAHSGDVWGTNLIALGDFNIDRAGDPLYEAFTSSGLRPPDSSTRCRAPSSTTPTRPRRPITGTSTTRLPGSPPPAASQSCKQSPRERRHVQLRQRHHSRHQHDATVLAHLRPLPALVRISPSPHRHPPANETHSPMPGRQRNRGWAAAHTERQQNAE